jgi:hypothetical protein
MTGPVIRRAAGSDFISRNLDSPLTRLCSQPLTASRLYLLHVSDPICAKPPVATPLRPYLMQVFAVRGWRLGTQKGSYVVTLSRPCLAKIFPPPFVLIHSAAQVRGQDEIPHPPLVNQRCCGTLTIGLIL